MVKRSQLWLLLLALVLAATVALVYRPSLSAGFAYDDEAQIVSDDFIHDRGHLADVLTLRVLAQDVLDGNRPMNLLSLMLDAAIWGRHPFGYHLTNVLLHALNALLLFLVLRDLLARGRPDPRALDPVASGGWGGDAPRTGAAWLAALLFALHPLATEAVCSPGFREDLLTGAFTLGLLALAALHRPGERPGVRIAIGSGIVACAFGAVAAKELGAVAPAILLAYGFIFRRTEPRRFWFVTLVASGLAVAGFLALRFWLEPASSLIFKDRPGYGPNAVQMLVTLQPRIWAEQLRLIVWPTGLCAYYGIHNLRYMPLPAALGILTVAIGAAGWLGWRARVPRFAALVYLLALLPVSNFVPIYIPMADRYLYLPLAGAAMLAAWLLHKALACPFCGRRAGALAVTVVVIALLAHLTTGRQAVWQSDLTLWTDTAARNPRASAAANNLASALLKRGRPAEALIHANTALQLSGGNEVNAWHNRGAALRQLGRAADAAQAEARARRLDYRYTDPELMRRALITPAGGTAAE